MPFGIPRQSIIPARHGRQAQAMVEFALALPIFLLIVYGLLEAGRAVFMYSAVVTASREGARYASASGVNSAENPNYQDCVAIRKAAKNVSFLINVPTTTSNTSTNGITIVYTIASPTGPITKTCSKLNAGAQTDITPTTGDFVTVSVWQQFNPIVRLVPFTSFMMQATSSRTLTGTIDLNPPTPGP